jgi:hypothetical protein
MRLRSTAAAALGALALLVALPASAHAASGEFSYSYSGLDGRPQRAQLGDPASGQCITLPEVADPGSSLPASEPLNRTTSRAVVFTGPRCNGDSFTLRAFDGRASDRLKLRSVLFLD